MFNQKKSNHSLPIFNCKKDASLVFDFIYDGNFFLYHGLFVGEFILEECHKYQFTFLDDIFLVIVYIINVTVHFKDYKILIKFIIFCLENHIENI